VAGVRNVFTTSEELSQVDHRAVIAWERAMREIEHAAPSTIRRRLSALSSLFKHLVRHGQAAKNPVREIERPAINRDEAGTGLNVEGSVGLASWLAGASRCDAEWERGQGNVTTGRLVSVDRGWDHGKQHVSAHRR